MPLTRDDLDHMASHHYASGRRRRRAFGSPVVLQGCCHRHVGTRATHDPATLAVEIRCAECDLFIIDVATTGGVARPASGTIDCPACGPTTPAWPTYWFRTGRLELECFGCGNVFATIPVRGETEEN